MTVLIDFPDSQAVLSFPTLRNCRLRKWGCHSGVGVGGFPSPLLGPPISEGWGGASPESEAPPLARCWCGPGRGPGLLDAGFTAVDTAIVVTHFQAARCCQCSAWAGLRPSGPWGWPCPPPQTGGPSLSKARLLVCSVGRWRGPTWKVARPDSRAPRPFFCSSRKLLSLRGSHFPSAGPRPHCPGRQMKNSMTS